MEYLGYQVEADEIERANRVGSKNDAKVGPRAIVVELVSYKLKQSILIEAANKLRHTPYRFVTNRLCSNYPITGWTAILNVI